MKSYVKAKQELDIIECRIRYLKSLSGRIDFKRLKIYSEDGIIDEIHDLESEIIELTNHLKELKRVMDEYKSNPKDLESIIFEKYFMKGWKPKGIAKFAHCSKATVYRLIKKIEDEN